MLQLMLLGLGLSRLACAVPCFSDAVPAAQRKNIFFDGKEMPVGLWELRWASSLITSSIWQILTEEKLGYNVSSDGGSSSRTVIYALAGCPISGTGSCEPVRYMHFSFESWHSYHDYIEEAFKTFGDKVPRRLGNLGYVGSDGMFVLGRSLENALNQSGVGLDFYRFYNVDFFNPALYTAKVSDVSLDRLLTCAESIVSFYPDSASEYLAATGDNNGVKTESGNTVLDCWQDKWWVAPACRTNPSGCIPCITSKEGWGISFMMQQAAFHNMPIAFASAKEDNNAGYAPLGRELQSLVYWWFPDTMFTLDNPSAVIFPAYSASEHNQNIYRTMSLWRCGWGCGAVAQVAHSGLRPLTYRYLYQAALVES